MPSEPNIPSLPSPTSVFVIGTDTGVGKTHAAAHLLRGWAASGHRAVGMKPVAAGTAPDDDDALRLRAASNVAVPAALDNPVRLPEPLSPHLSAQRAGVAITLAPIVAAFRALQQRAEVVVVEGAGGFLVPLDEPAGGGLLTGAGLAEALGLPVVLVVGIRLGCLNHALLTAEAVRARGLTLAGWIANRVDPDMACADDNVAFLRRHLPAPLWADLPYSPTPHD
ncbi:dethiobiotin synthase [Sphaerotilus montanus]|uniref:ATP-dependent dethiobiotin synthetase BioD n=1 Tax=Sphaerotilus montanus TaxID=522889 RepID=A0A7Y9R1Q7_9BURK|nr:dethiobiotin synthase [Sphaerotilus montanus]NYG33908.1 dethiobiotin synthetase [Sphaerotilus montanus]NZD59136.1 dethiobiotin synthase [Sphaerotilus montanus]